MATNSGIAPHETFELHEILTFKNVCATKSATMAGLVQDAELKSLLQNDFSVSQAQIRELQSLIRQSDLAAEAGTAGTAAGARSDIHLVSSKY